MPPALNPPLLAGGTFNTPQILMLSGIGRPDALAAHDIKVIESLPGVGKNLQDRYEVSVVNRMKAPWDAMRGAKFDRSDRHYCKWRRFRKGLYTSNGGMLSVILSSSSKRQHPDLYCLALLAKFPGYLPGYSEGVKQRNYLSWIVCELKLDSSSDCQRFQTGLIFSQQQRDIDRYCHSVW